MSEKHSVFNKIKSVLIRGEVVATPTDTVWGLAVLPFVDGAIEKLFQIKKRPIDKKIPLLVSGIEMTKKLCVVDGEIEKLLNKYWPGALTVELKKKINNERIAIRMPSDDQLLELIEYLKEPLAVTSANLSGEAEINDCQKLQGKFGSQIGYYWDRETIFSGKASTLVDLSISPFVVLRQGDIQIAEFMEKE